jgi:Methyltransferase domain
VIHRLTARESHFSDRLRAMDRYRDNLHAIGPDKPPAPRWNQDWFPRLDAAMAYTQVRDRRPRRMVEVGCGHSTRFFWRAVADGGLATGLTAIDPEPRATLDGLPGLRLIDRPVQEVGVEPFAALAAGDILSIDSSHKTTPGGDVDFLLSDVLPGLPAGVAVHFHDMFMPDDYPESWAWRGYDEAPAIEAMIAGGGWSIDFASHYAVSRMAVAVAGSVAGALPLAEGAIESSLWLEHD